MHVFLRAGLEVHARKTWQEEQFDQALTKQELKKCNTSHEGRRTREQEGNCKEFKEEIITKSQSRYWKSRPRRISAEISRSLGRDRWLTAVAKTNSAESPSRPVLVEKSISRPIYLEVSAEISISRPRYRGRQNCSMNLQSPFQPLRCLLHDFTTINRTLYLIHRHPSKPRIKEGVWRSTGAAFEGGHGFPLLPKVKPPLHERVISLLALRA